MGAGGFKSQENRKRSNGAWKLGEAKHRQTHRHTDRHTHRHTDTRTQTQRHRDTQTHKQTHAQAHPHLLYARFFEDGVGHEQLEPFLQVCGAKKGRGAWKRHEEKQEEEARLGRGKSGCNSEHRGMPSCIRLVLSLRNSSDWVLRYCFLGSTSATSSRWPNRFFSCRDGEKERYMHTQTHRHTHVHKQTTMQGANGQSKNNKGHCVSARLCLPCIPLCESCENHCIGEGRSTLSSSPSAH